MTSTFTAVESGSKSKLRGFMAEHPVLSAILPVLIVAAVLAWRFWPAPQPKAYYSIDDGKSFFAHTVEVPPFTYQGKEGDRAMVFSDGNSPFVGYLLRYTSAGKAALEEAQRHPDAAVNRGVGVDAPYEVKRPGNSDWISAPRSSVFAAIKHINESPSQSNLEKFQETVAIRDAAGKLLSPLNP